MFKSLDGIKTVLNLHQKDVRERYKIKEIGIFGSFVRGEQKKRM